MLFDLFTSIDDLGDTLHVRVTPKASRDRVEMDHDPVSGQRLIRVYVTAPPEDGAANAAVVKLLAKGLGVSKSSLTLVRGHKSRDKVFTLAS